MRDVPSTMTAAWKSGNFVGNRRPVVRATVQHCHMKLFNYTLTSTYTRVSLTGSGIPSINVSGGIDPLHGEKIAQTYADFLWSNSTTPLEIPNILSVEWTRSVNVDTAECTIVIRNTAPLAPGQAPLPGKQFEQPGYYHPYHGASSFSTRWGHEQNEWLGKLMPDNVIRTFEGYGTDLDSDPDSTPETDSHLVLTGVWLIDSVSPSAAGLTLTIKARDMGRLFLEQKVYTPVIPTQFYPVTFQNWDQKVRIGGATVKKGRLRAKPVRSSNWPYVGDTGAIHGHRTKDAFDGSGDSYWMSVGNPAPSKRYAYEWVQAEVKGGVSEVRFTPKKKGYTAYLHLKVNGSWVGAHSINYHTDGVGEQTGDDDHRGDIPYFKSMVVKSEREHKFSFPMVKGVQAIRITLGNLQHFAGTSPSYRAGLRDVKVYGEAVTNTTREVPLKIGPAGANPGRCQDFTEIIKLAAAWAGLFWPVGASLTYTDGTAHELTPAKADTAALGGGVRGAVWGDFESTGTAPPLPLDPSSFDKRSLMDIVVYVRDLVGYFFGIDESGAVQWRLPNFFELGNYRTGLSANPGRTKDMIVIDESSTLRELNSTLSSANVREGIWVGDPAGTFATVRPGWNPNPTGMRRMSGWTDYHFASVEEARMAGDMIAVRQLMEYWKDSLTIHAYPAIQIDDQVRIFEGSGAEGYVHYVRSITSRHDTQTGEWLYNIETNWLGQDPEARWVFTLPQLGEEARAHIEQALGLTYSPDSRV